MLKKILIVVAVLIVVILIIAATRPDSFRVERSTTIKASPAKIFPLINDFHNWPAWSPWEKLDPTMTRTYSGAPAGKGTVYEWKGSGKVGAGRMEITDASAPSKIIIKLDFIKPFEGHDTTAYTLEPQGDSTKVTWTMSGPMPFVSKIMCLFVNMDRMIGKDFETGLANLKSLAEK
jgi:uncharacterized protein YndB with AHSA1/START domain